LEAMLAVTIATARKILENFIKGSKVERFVLPVTGTRRPDDS